MKDFYLNHQEKEARYIPHNNHQTNFIEGEDKTQHYLNSSNGNIMNETIAQQIKRQKIYNEIKLTTTQIIAFVLAIAGFFLCLLIMSYTNTQEYYYSNWLLWFLLFFYTILLFFFCWKSVMNISIAVKFEFLTLIERFITFSKEAYNKKTKKILNKKEKYTENFAEKVINEETILPNFFGLKDKNKSKSRENENYYSTTEKNAFYYNKIHGMNNHLQKFLQKNDSHHHTMNPNPHFQSRKQTEDIDISKKNSIVSNSGGKNLKETIQLKNIYYNMDKEMETPRKKQSGLQKVFESPISNNSGYGGKLISAYLKRNLNYNESLTDNEAEGTTPREIKENNVEKEGKENKQKEKLSLIENMNKNNENIQNLIDNRENIENSGNSIFKSEEYISNNREKERVESERDALRNNSKNIINNINFPMRSNSESKKPELISYSKASIRSSLNKFFRDKESSYSTSKKLDNAEKKGISFLINNNKTFNSFFNKNNISSKKSNVIIDSSFFRKAPELLKLHLMKIENDSFKKGLYKESLLDISDYTENLKLNNQDSLKKILDENNFKFSMNQCIENLKFYVSSQVLSKLTNYNVCNIINLNNLLLDLGIEITTDIKDGFKFYGEQIEFNREYYSNLNLDEISFNHSSETRIRLIKDKIEAKLEKSSGVFENSLNSIMNLNNVNRSRLLSNMSHKQEGDQTIKIFFCDIPVLNFIIEKLKQKIKKLRLMTSDNEVVSSSFPSSLGINQTVKSVYINNNGFNALTSNNDYPNVYLKSKHTEELFEKIIVELNERKNINESIFPDYFSSKISSIEDYMIIMDYITQRLDYLQRGVLLDYSHLKGGNYRDTLPWNSFFPSDSLLLSYSLIKQLTSSIVEKSDLTKCFLLSYPLQPLKQGFSLASKKILNSLGKKEETASNQSLTNNSTFLYHLSPFNYETYFILINKGEIIQLPRVSFLILII